MIDDTPDLKWSGAWWAMIFLGIALPSAMLIIFFLSIYFDTAYSVATARYRKIQFIEVHGQQALLLAFSYLGIGISAFSYGYARFHDRLGFYYDKMLAVGLMLVFFTFAWSKFLYLKESL